MFILFEKHGFILLVILIIISINVNKKNIYNEAQKIKWIQPKYFIIVIILTVIVTNIILRIN